MNIIIPTIGTRGDLQPYIALALGLQRAGHTPTLATHPEMRALVESYGLPFAPIGPDINIGVETAKIRDGARHWAVGFLRVMRFSFAMLEAAHEDLLHLCRQTDLIIVSHTAAGSTEADKLGAPFISVTLMPQAIPAPDPNAPLLHKVFGKLAGAGMGLLMTRPMDGIRKRVGAPRLGPAGVTSPALNLIPISPHVSPPHPLWEPRHKVTGYWFAPAPETWSPPERLQQFLNAGDPPIVISLGAMSISGKDALEAAQITLQAVQQAGVRAIIQGWDAPIQTLHLPESVLHLGPAPHEWLLQHASGIVHHGGFGTTSAGFRAGIPSLAIPHIIDQYLWGAKIQELGVGPHPIPRAKLTTQALTAALTRMQEDSAMKYCAAALGEKIRAEQGVAEAIRAIQEIAPDLKKRD